MSWTAIGAYVIDQVLGIARANELRNNAIALASSRFQHYLGGSRQFGLRSASYVDAVDYLDVELDGTNLTGLTVRARVEVRTANTGTTVTPKIRNVTDASDAVVGAAYGADTNWDAQTLSFTPVAGVKTYRLQLTGSNATDDIFGVGYVEIFATA